MKYNFLYFFISLIFANSESYFEYYPNDSLKVKGSYLVNKMHGKWEYYNLKGKVWKYIIYENGKKIDEMKWQIFKPKQSEIDALKKIKNKNIKIEMIETINDNILDSLNTKIQNPMLIGYTGDWIKYHDNGVLECVIEYMNGLKHGKANYYDENKKLIRTERYLSGKKHGKWLWYWSNNEIKEMGYYNSDKKHGKWIKFDEKGKEILIKNF